MAYVYSDRTRDDVLRMIPPDGRTIASIGCGQGATELVLVQEGRQVHGVDISCEAIAVAQTRLTSARTIAADDHAPFPPDSMDGLILADVLEHMPHAWQALEQLSKMVHSGGWIVISVPNMRSWKVLRKFILLGDWPEHPGGIFDQTHVQVMSLKRLKRWCGRCGLRVARVYDRYDPNVRYRYWVARVCDMLTLRLFHNWFMFQVQIVCRRHDAGTTG